MNTIDNSPTVVVRDKTTLPHMTQEGEEARGCMFCDDEQDKDLTHAAIFSKEANAERAVEPLKRMWLCEDHYDKLVETCEYRVRELPTEAAELGHSSREKIQEQGRDYVVILEPENENKWLKAPDTLETDLTDER